MTAPTHIVPARDQAASETYSFSQAVWNDGTLYCSGQIGVAADGAIPARMTDQFRQAWDNVGGILKEAGIDWHDIIDITTYHIRLSETLPAFAEIKRDYIKLPFPTWTAIGVAELGYPDAVVEIRVIARRPR